MLGDQDCEAIKSLMKASEDDFVCKYVNAKTARKVLKSQTVRLSPFKTMNDPRETEGGRFECADFVGDETPPDAFEIERRFGKDLRCFASVFCAARDDCEGDRNLIMRRGFGKSRMWAQYGGDHKGACLVFRRSLLEDVARAALGRDRLWFGNVDYNRALLDAGAGAHFILIIMSSK